jgi:hypothetical protein
MVVSSHRRRLLTLLALMALGGPAGAQQGTWALVNARIETVTKGVIDRGTIIIRDGLIEAVGAGLTPPADARVVDFTGRTIAPAFIDLTSSMGLPAAAATAGRGGGGGGGQQQPATRFVGLEPGRMIANELAIPAADLRGARDAGIAAALIAPNRGAMRGLSALVPMRDVDATQFVVRSPVALHLGFQGAPNRYPETLLGVIAYERQKFYDAQRHALMVDRYRQVAGRGVQRPSYDADLDALVPVVRGTIPAFFAAGNENEIRRALDIGREFNLKLTIVGATEAFRAMDALKSARPVVVSVDFPQPTDVTGWAMHYSQRLAADDSATRTAAIRRVVEGNAATLNKAGIKFALASGGTNASTFLGNVKKAIAAGLPRDAALEALTIRAAEIAGVEAQLGSIEVGKIANLVVSDGDVLAANARIRAVFVDGLRYEIDARPQQQAAGGNRAGGATAQVAGVWEMTTNSPNGAIATTLTTTQNGDVLDGTMQTPFGVITIANGEVEGSTVRWTMHIQMGGETMQVAYEAQVEGNRMTGRATITGPNAATMTFTGERKP